MPETADPPIADTEQSPRYLTADSILGLDSLACFLPVLTGATRNILRGANG
jgi:hypothetical protein